MFKKMLTLQSSDMKASIPIHRAPPDTTQNKKKVYVCKHPLVLCYAGSVLICNVTSHFNAPPFP